MIQLSRWRIRRICDVLRATVWAATGDPSLPVLIQASRDQLTISSQGGGFAVAHTERGNYEPGVLVLPGTFLQEYEGWSDSVVLLQPITLNRCLVTWWAGSVGWRLVHDTPAAANLTPFPHVPSLRNLLRADQVCALNEAMKTASNRHPEWSKIELRGSGVVAATDGKQILLQTGFHFPWTEDVVVPRTEVFDCDDFHQRWGYIGRTDSQVVIEAGEWTIALPIDKQARFPRIEASLPPATAYAATWDFSQENVETLRHSLSVEQDWWDKNDRSLSLIITGWFLQARVGGYPAGADLRLPWAHLASWAQGVPSTGSFLTSRRYFLRSLELGFREFLVHGVGGVFQCRDNSRLYAWAASDSLVHPAAESTRPEPAEVLPPERETKPAFPLRAILARHPITGWLTVFVIKQTDKEYEKGPFGPDSKTLLREYFEDFLKKYGLLGVEQQMEELRRLADDFRGAPAPVSRTGFGWLRGAYTRWLTSCVQFTQETGSESVALRPEAGGGHTEPSRQLLFPVYVQPPPPRAVGSVRPWQQVEPSQREVVDFPRRSEDEEPRGREAWHAEVRADRWRSWCEQREAERCRRQEEDARKPFDITFLGRGVSAGLADRRSDVEKLTTAGLPVMSTPGELAQAMGLTIRQLRWLAYHKSVSSRVHYVSFTVPKKSGGERTLHAPLHLMGRAQRWVLETLVDRLPVEEPCHGFRAGRGTLSNAQPHAGQAVVVNMDLAGFFPSIGFRRVCSVFERLGYSPAVSTILALLCTACPRREEFRRGERCFVATGPRGLPQGACTSPALANQVARRLDRRLDGLVKSLGGAYTRYADDLAFSGGEVLLERIGYLMNQVRRIVKEEGFTINEKKTRVQRRHSAQVVTGLVVNDKPGVVRREVRRLRAILHRARTEGLDKQNREGRENFLAWLHGKIGYVCMARPEVGARLQAELRAILDQEAGTDSPASQECQRPEDTVLRSLTLPARKLIPAPEPCPGEARGKGAVSESRHLPQGVPCTDSSAAP